MKTLEKKPRNKIPEGGETFPLAKAIADELGDVPEGTPVTMAMFQRCLYRLADIRSGRVQKPTQCKATPTVALERLDCLSNLPAVKRIP